MIRELLEEGSIIEIFATVVAFGLIAAAILCLIYIIVGGISFILSAGNEEKIKRAVNTIRYAIVGVIVSFFAYFLVAIISRLLNIPFPLTFGTIVDLMNEIFDALQ